MHSSALSGRDSADYAAVRELVAQRVGRRWCLFLDRDGVINQRVVGDYVRSWQQFEWLPKAPEALKELRVWAPRIVIVTNQQGVGKGLMSAQDVLTIHERLQSELASDGAELDGFQVCPHLASGVCDCRKPRPGLILDWLSQHPGCDASLSIMVGDSSSDLELARNVGQITGGCGSIQIGRVDHGGIADASFNSLWDLAAAVVDVRGGVGR